MVNTKSKNSTFPWPLESKYSLEAANTILGKAINQSASKIKKPITPEIEYRKPQ